MEAKANLPQDDDDSGGDGRGGHGWLRRGDQEFEDPRNPNFCPTPKQVRHLVPMLTRYAFTHWARKVLSRRKPPIDGIRLKTSLAMYGVPCGGIGSGTIGRGFRGEFCRFQMLPGDYSHKIVWEDAFHLLIKDADSGEELFRSVLASGRNRKLRRAYADRVRSWQYNVRDEDIHFRALYPRSWTMYVIPELDLELTCRQVSPFLPRDYTDACLPTSLFRWSVKNKSGRDVSVTLALSFADGWGKKVEVDAKSQGFKDGDMAAKMIHQKVRGLRLSYGIACQRGFTLPDFDPAKDGSDFQESLQKDQHDDRKKLISKRVGVGVGNRVVVTAGESIADLATFALCWDQPEIKFAGQGKVWRRWYTKFFPSTQDKVAALDLLRHAFKSHQKWNDAIESWQRPTLSDPKIPDWLKSAAFNELYYLADGGSQWLIVDKNEKDEDVDPRLRFGRFCYLESHEYRMFNTYDVHFYASHALADLFPGLELSLQCDFVDFTSCEDRSRVTELYRGKPARLNSPFAVPHDLGDPEDEPYVNINAYRIHDVSEWKDLALKFVISTWRDFRLLSQEGQSEEVRKSAEFLAERAAPVCVEVMEKALKWDTDGDGLIENSGFPDQTYDSWCMTGPSSYCNSLWLAALRSVVRMAERTDRKEAAAKFEEVLDRAKSSFSSKLWQPEGGYFAFDSTERGRDTVMSDQLCGRWYLNLIARLTSEEDDDTFDGDKVRRALKTIYECNVRGTNGGSIGAANGFRFSVGTVDTSAIQSEEIWTGSSYALASLMITEGLIEEGLATAKGVYKTVYDRCGLGFETPEALYRTKHYRAIGYMRPLSIWAVLQAMNTRKL